MDQRFSKHDTGVEIKATRGLLSSKPNEPHYPLSATTSKPQWSTYPTGLPEAQGVLNRVLGSVRKPVYLLDITTLSQSRKDAHPSSYGGGSGIDCGHWCLPGLPDTWNQTINTQSQPYTHQKRKRENRIRIRRSDFRAKDQTINTQSPNQKKEKRKSG
ncbi:hypothetical protein L1887_16964 [Cichorium endivia]|nr:hypothetical protein L1887_16964 [Cichorium endivia]